MQSSKDQSISGDSLLTTASVGVEQINITTSWQPFEQTNKELDKQNIDAAKQMKYLVKFISIYSAKIHMFRTQEEWNDYFYEFCLNQEILKFNESGNSPFCAHDFNCEHHRSTEVE